MEKINYAAAAAYHVHGDTFIDFPSDADLEALEAGKETRLRQQLARQFGFLAALPDDQVIRERLQATDRLAELAEYAKLRSGLDHLEDVKHLAPDAYANQAQLLDGKLREWQARGWLPTETSMSVALADNINSRRELYAAKFDPFRLAVEHEALRQTKLEGTTDFEGRTSYVRFTAPDEWIAPERAIDREEQVALTRRVLG